MQDFSKKYRGAVYFGLGLEEAADQYGKRDAFKVLTDAAAKTYEQDVRGEQIDDALSFLSRFETRDQPFRNFRQALDIADARERYFAVRNALVRIRLCLTGE
jgi:hypothetical protein